MKRKLDKYYSQIPELKVRKTVETSTYSLEFCDIYIPPELFHIFLSFLRNNPFYFRLQRVSKSWKHFIHQYCSETKQINLLQIYCHGNYKLLGYPMISTDIYLQATESFIRLYPNATSISIYIPTSWEPSILQDYNYKLEDPFFLYHFLEWFCKSPLCQASSIQELSIEHISNTHIIEFSKDNTIDISKTKISKIFVRFPEDFYFLTSLVRDCERTICFVPNPNTKNYCFEMMNKQLVSVLKNALQFGVPIPKIISTAKLYDWIVYYPTIAIYYLKEEPAMMESFALYIERQQKVQEYYDFLDEFNPIQVLVDALKQNNRKRMLTQQMRTSLDSLIKLDMKHNQLWLKNLKLEDDVPKNLISKFKTLQKKLKNTELN